MTPPIPGHIFISYSRRDDEIMRKIAFFLRDQGFKVWVDNEKLISGTAAWEESIENAIKDAFVVIVILSPDAKGSEWVRREIACADQYNKRVFPVLVKGDEDASLPIRLITRQYVDFRQDEDAGLSALNAALTFYIEKKQTLEMPRPPGQQKIIPSTPQQAQSSTKWMLPAGISVALLCLLAMCAVAGSRIYSSLTSSGQTDISTTQPTTVISPPSTSVPIPDTATIPITGSDILSAYLNDVQILSVDTFDNQSEENWSVTAGTVHDSILEITGNENWDGTSNNRKLEENEGIVIDFNYSDAALFEMFIDSSEFNTDPYRRFGIYIDNNQTKINEWIGKDNLGGTTLSGDLTLQPNTIYSLLIAVLPDGKFLVAIWNPSDPSKTLEYQKTPDATMAGLNWVFNVGANQGIIQFDNYMAITFSGAK